MKQTFTRLAVPVCAALFISATQLHSQQFPLLAVGTLDESRAGAWADVSGLTYKLENGVPANDLGGFGSAITYVGGNTFLALPDRGPNAVEFNDAVDNTVAYVNRFTPCTLNSVRIARGPDCPMNWSLNWKRRRFSGARPRLSMAQETGWISGPAFHQSITGFSTFSRGVQTDLTRNIIPAIPTMRVSTRRAFVFRTMAEAYLSPTSTDPISINLIVSLACA